MSFRNLPTHQRVELGHRLTTRQLHIYILRLGGYSWQRISHDTGLSIRTVRTHARRAHQIHQEIEREQEAAA